MVNNPLLSICIPTYNRAEFLKDALDSIITQINENNNVEICVSDNASEDNTEDLVIEYQRKSPIPIIYHKNEKNMGADYNFMKAVEIANGEYCWLLGSDDIIEEGGVDTILIEIENNPDVDIFTFDKYTYSKDMKFKTNKHNPPKKGKLKNNPIFNSVTEVLKYSYIFFGYLISFGMMIYLTDVFSSIVGLNNSVSIPIVFSISMFKCLNYLNNAYMDLGYISLLVFNRKKWLSIKGYEKWYGTVHIHIYIIYSMIKNGSKVKYIGKELVGWRSDNDSFLDDLKEYGRFKISLSTLDIIKDIFGRNSEEYRLFKKNFLYKWGVWGRIIRAKVNNNPKNFYINIFKDMYPIYKYNLFFWLWYVPLMLIPSVFYRPLTNRYKRRYT